MLIPDYVRLMAYRKVSTASAVPSYLRKSSTSGAVRSAFDGISLDHTQWPSNGKVEIVSILDPLL
jgi:hypothetical protein